MTLFLSGTICQLPWWKLSYSLTLISELSSPYNLLSSLPLFSGFSLICSPPVGQFIFLPSTRLFCLCFLPVYYLICDPFLQPVFCFFFFLLFLSVPLVLLWHSFLSTSSCYLASHWNSPGRPTSARLSLGCPMLPQDPALPASPYPEWPHPVLTVAEQCPLTPLLAVTK